MGDFQIAHAHKLTANAVDGGLTRETLRMCMLAPATLSDIAYLETLKRGSEGPSNEAAPYTPAPLRSDDLNERIEALIFRPEPGEA